MSISFAGNILMVVGGSGAGEANGGSDKAYAISLKSSVAVPSCLESICDFPNYIYAGISAIFDDGLPTVCGGRKHKSGTTYFQECYKFNYTDAWDPVGSKNYFSAISGTKLRHIY